MAGEPIDAFIDTYGADYVELALAWGIRSLMLLRILRSSPSGKLLDARSIAPRWRMGIC